MDIVHNGGLFDWIHKNLFIQEDRARFLLSTFSCIPLGYVLRRCLFYSGHLSCIYIIFIGLVFSFFCFGLQGFHVVAMIAICYGLFFIVNPKILGHVVLVVSFVYLCYCQIYRMVYDYSNYTLDVSGAIMMLVQKTTSAAFEYSDDCKSAHKNKQPIPPPPSFLHYFAYCLFYPAIFTGPTFKLSYFTETVTCYQERKIFAFKSHVNYLKPMLTKFMMAFIFLLINHYGLLMLPQTTITAANSSVGNYSFSQYVVRVYFLALITRFQYYGGIALGESLCNGIFFGFNGFKDENNTSKQNWDYLIGMKPWSFETGTNLKICVDSWNITTSNWLRFVVYNRVRSFRVLATFMLSALWHGFYPGYYLTFFAGAIGTLIARKMRYLFRPYFVGSKWTLYFYHILTWLFTQYFLMFFQMSFIFYEITDIIFVWKQLYFSGMFLVIIGGTIAFLTPSPNIKKKIS